MKAHYTTFEGEEQFNLLRDKARQLDRVVGYCVGETLLGMLGKYQCLFLMS